jgi:hypothetical protein
MRSQKFTVPKHGIVGTSLGLGKRDMGTPVRHAAKAIGRTTDTTPKLRKRKTKLPDNARLVLCWDFLEHWLDELTKAGGDQAIPAFMVALGQLKGKLELLEGPVQVVKRTGEPR